MNLTLKMKITTMVILAVIVPLSGTGAYIYFSQKDDIESRSSVLLKEIGGSAATLMDNYIVERSKETGLVSGSSTLRSTPESAAYGLNRYRATFNEFDSLIFIGNDGKLIAESGNILLTQGEKNLQQAIDIWFPDIQSGKMIIDRAIPSVGDFDRYLLFIARAEHDNKEYGWVVGQVDSEKIASIAIAVKIGETGRSTLFNENGILIGHENKSRYGYDMKKYSIMNEPLKNNRGDPGDFFLSGDGREKWGQTRLLEKSLVRFGLKWGVIVDQTKSEMYAPIYNLRNAILVGITTGVILFSLLGFMLASSTTNPINNIITCLTEGADQVTDASGQVSAASQQLAEGATEQAASLEAINSALEEMASMSRQNADNAKEASGLSETARDSAQRGNASMKEMQEAMGAINESSSQIGKIIKVIEAIAFQTNLLALNAAVEAARAGDAGKGFAVVADEVRNLAQRSAEAAKDTTNLIQVAVERARKGTRIANESDQALAEIVGNVQKVAGLINDISAASQEQAQGVDQVNAAVAQMDKITQSNAANAEESASASEELSAQAEQLRDMVGQLAGLVGGGADKTEGLPGLHQRRQAHERGGRGYPRRLSMSNL